MVGKHCLGRNCLRGSPAGDRDTAIGNPKLFNPDRCECSCVPCRAPRGSGDFSIGSRVWPGTSKLIEEMGELNQVLGKLIAVGGATDHWSGDLRKMLVEEIGDAMAAIRFFVDQNLTVEEGTSVAIRSDNKLVRFTEWQLDPQPPPVVDTASSPPPSAVVGGGAAKLVIQTNLSPEDLASMHIVGRAGGGGPSVAVGGVVPDVASEKPIRWRCTSCNGTGDANWRDGQVSHRTCPACGGTGKLDRWVTTGDPERTRAT